MEAVISCPLSVVRAPAPKRFSDGALPPLGGDKQEIGKTITAGPMRKPDN